jgi:hypothetical protein
MVDTKGEDLVDLVCTGMKSKGTKEGRNGLTLLLPGTNRGFSCGGAEGQSRLVGVDEAAPAGRRAGEGVEFPTAGNETSARGGWKPWNAECA